MAMFDAAESLALFFCRWYSFHPKNAVTAASKRVANGMPSPSPSCRVVEFEFEFEFEIEDTDVGVVPA